MPIEAPEPELPPIGTPERERADREHAAMMEGILKVGRWDVEGRRTNDQTKC